MNNSIIEEIILKKAGFKNKVDIIIEKNFKNDKYNEVNFRLILFSLHILSIIDKGYVKRNIKIKEIIKKIKGKNNN